MKYLTLFLLGILAFQSVIAQEMSGNELLDKAIKYHDPNGNWSHFKGELFISMTTPNNSKRDSEISIDLPNQYFSVRAKQDTIITKYTLNKDNCSISLNGKSELSKAELFSNNLSCDRANMYKNYYTYLYGLPMKLEDNGTIIHDKVERKTFKNKEYLVLKATYEKSVGSDVWYFYFNPDTYAMNIYQFFKTDDNGKEISDSGEYILLSEEAVIKTIKMPKVRAWYYNKDDKYLGTDTLEVK